MYSGVPISRVRILTPPYMTVGSTRKRIPAILRDSELIVTSGTMTRTRCARAPSPRHWPGGHDELGITKDGGDPFPGASDGHVRRREYSHSADWHARVHGESAPPGP